jgi:hypothetical protein
MASRKIPTPHAVIVPTPREKKTDGNIMQQILAWILGPTVKLFWSPVIHFVCCIALVLSMVHVINGYHAVSPDSYRTVNGHFKLRVSDVTTLVSAALTVIKLIVSVWTGIILWNCVFILLERPGIHVNQVQRVLAFYIPPWPKTRSVLLVSILLLLVIPQQLISPLLSGALDWGYGSELQPDAIQVQSGDPAVTPLNWYWYFYNKWVRRAAVRRAAAYASIAWDNSTLDRGNCRHIMNDLSEIADPKHGSAVNSTAMNVVMPCLQIHSISFPSTPPSTEIWNLISESVSDEGSDRLTRVSDAPLAYGTDGDGVLFDVNDRPSYQENFPNGSSLYMEVPAPYRQSGLMTAVIIVNASYWLNGNNCTDIKDQSIFGPTKYNNIFSTVQSGNYYYCMTYAEVNLTAGITVSSTSKYITPRVIEADMNPMHMELLEGPWVHEAMYLMPNVMSMFSQMNSTPMPTWGNLENYTAKLIRYSYQGAWDALSRSYEPNTSSIPVHLYEPRQVAIVSRKRVYAWLAISLLLQVSCFVLIFGSRLLRRENILDGNLSALLTDPTALYEKTGERFNPSFIETTVSKKLGTISLQRKDNQGYRLIPKD